MGVDEENKTVNCRFISTKQLPYRVHFESSILKEIIPRVPLHLDKTKKVKQIKGWVVLSRRYIEENGRRTITYQNKDIYESSITLEDIGDTSH